VTGLEPVPEVTISLGRLRGVEDKTVGGKTIYKFLGVPYARPPVGKHRFKEPQAVQRWAGTWDATEHGADCLQPLTPHWRQPDTVTGEEDCLYLNIYTPSLANTSELPVLLFIHEGSFIRGSGKTVTPHFLLDRGDFVFVSVNYRLGPFGFMSTGDGVISGNNGLKDQVLALKWVQEHIHAFGSDKNEVTIAGLEAGGASVHLHYLSPLSRGLFKRGISMSGTAYCPWVMAEKSSEKALLLASALGCPTNSTYEMIKCLGRRPTGKIVSQIRPLFWKRDDFPMSPFGVVIEAPGNRSFLSEHPHSLTGRGEVADVPLLTSFTSEEGLFPVAPYVNREELMKELNDNWHQIAPHLLDYESTVLPQNFVNISQKVKDYYFEKGDEISILTRDHVIELVGDRLFVVGIENAARHQASVAQSPVYLYRFSYKGKHSVSNSITGSSPHILGVSQGDDLIYILSRSTLSPLETEEDKAMMEKMTNIWVSFITTGTPSPDTAVQWDAVNQNPGNVQGDLTYLDIVSSEDISQFYSFDLGFAKFWNSLNLDGLVIVDDKILKDEL